MPKRPKTKVSFSSSFEEKITLAYAESPRHEGTEKTTSDSYFSSSTSTTSSTSLDTPGPLESVGSLLNILDTEKEKGKFFGYYPVWQDLSLTEGPKLNTLEYFWENKIFQLFTFMISHLLAHTPDEPIPFLISLIERCIQYRDVEGEPPLLFEDGHIKSVYTSLDPANNGEITHGQYLTGMNTFGIADFNIMPNDLTDKRNVSKDMFMSEARQALLDQLDEMIGKKKALSITVDESSENVEDYEQTNTQYSEGLGPDPTITDSYSAGRNNTSNFINQKWYPTKIAFHITSDLKSSFTGAE